MTTKERIEQLDTAITAIELGGQEYQMGSRRLRRADLARLYEERRLAGAQLERENGGHVYVAVFEGR